MPKRATVDRHVPYVGSLDLRLPVSVERMFENALDWEHLPWVHAASFTEIEAIDSGDWGWDAYTTLARRNAERVRIELHLERERMRWITRTLEGDGTGTEIWTHVTPVAEREIDLVIDFFVPTESIEEIERAHTSHTRLYRQLYDEDLAMMLDRQAALDERAGTATHGSARVELGAADRLRADAPRVVEAFGARWRVVCVDGDLFVHSARCPHRGGSLLEAAIEEKQLVCPWHGYRFDIASGACVSGPRCQLDAAPSLRIDEREDAHLVAPST